MTVSLPPFDGRQPWWSGNLHCHSDRSDGLLPPETVAGRYAAAGYDFLAITDHFVSAFDFPITVPAAEFDGLRLIPGAELHAPATSHGEWWHVLAVGLPLEFPRTGPAEHGPALARRAQAAGAFVAIAHPECSGLSERDATALSFAHAVEVYNHTSALRTDRGGGWPWLERLWDQDGWQYPIAVDDAHFHVDDAFGGWIWVRAASPDPENLLPALKAGHLYASQGPSIHDVRLKDDGIEVDCSPVEAVFILGPGAQSKYRLGRSLSHAAFEWPDTRSWLRIAVRDRQGKHAWTGRLDLAR
jgi:hypothetical protein